ncbi:transcription factor bHLH92 [Humulus lupulus]|uniref:transcription factor bHLH92 n=1 Tax=Humulus lupulus TaxID=3486 RepID=UPI002B4178A5|nr:transcription factor bHLH92 [Humulus lupulus]
MDVFFSDECFSGDALWYRETIIPTTRSAFERYREEPRKEFMQRSSNKMNTNKRMIDWLRRRSLRSSNTNNQVDEHEKERCYRHMMNERLRREKQKQSFLDLHSMLPMGTKNDKKSVVQIATMKIQQLEKYKEELNREKMKLEETLFERNNNNDGNSSTVKGGTNNKIKVRVANPTSGVDLMVEVLNCLKKLGLKAINIRSDLSSDEFYAELDIETKVGAAEIEKAMQQTLLEAEWKSRSYFMETGLDNIF